MMANTVNPGTCMFRAAAARLIDRGLGRGALPGRTTGDGIAWRDGNADTVVGAAARLTTDDPTRMHGGEVDTVRQPGI